MRTKTNSKLLNLYSGLSKKFNGILGVALALAIVFSSFTFAIPMVANADGIPTPTVYVDDTGNDETADGSSDKPFLTLNSAIAKVKEGSNSGTVIVKNCLTIPASDFTWDNHSGVDVTITGGTIDASARSSLYIKDNVTFKDVTVKWPTQNDKRVYAMGYKLVIESDVIFDGVIGEIYGGAENTTVKSTNLTLCGGTYDYIFGGSRTGSSSDNIGKVSGNTNVLIDGNVVAKYLCAGGCDSTVAGNTNLTVKAGSFNYIFGGGYALTRKGEIDPEVKGDTNVLIDGNVNPEHSYTSDSNQPAIYGGSKCGTVGGNTNITVKSGNFGFVFGGGADDKDTTPLSTVKGSSNIDFSGNAYCIYGGAKYAKGSSANITVRDNANVYQIFGGSENNSAEGNISINILGGTVYRRIYGGSYNNYSLGWADTNNHVTGNIGITVMPTANLQLNCDNDNSFYALSRGESAFDDEYGTLVLNDTYYSQISSKVGPNNVVAGAWSTKAYHYLVTTNGNLADGSMGNVLCENNSLKITPAKGYLATVKSDGQEDATFESVGSYDLPAVNKDDAKNITVTFSPKPQPEEIAVFQNGDVNMDKYVDILDLVKTKKALAYEDTDALMDIVNDQNINADDISALKQILLSDNSSNYSEFNTYDDLATAVTDVNADGGFIVVKKDISMSSTIKLTASLKNIRIINEPGKDVTITRDGDFEMFNISNSDYSLNLGSFDENGSLTIVASTESAAEKRVVVNSGTFTLGKNAIIKNANGKSWGNVLINYAGTANLYGNITDNTTAYTAGGVVLQNTAGGKITFYDGNYSDNSVTGAGSYAGLFNINAGEVEIKGGTFSGNTAKTKCELGNVKSGATLTITGGIFDENQSINVDGTAYIGGSANSFNLVKGAGSIIVNDSLSDSKIQITANGCTSGTTILTKGDLLDAEVFADVCKKAVISSNNQMRCALDKDGKIVYLDTITIDEIPNSNYDSLASAVAAAKELTSATIKIDGIVSLSTGLTISNDITITNDEGKDAVIKRNSDILMFNVSTTGKLTLGSDDMTGSLTVDAAIDKLSTTRVVDNSGTFVLGKNATIKNANSNSTPWGNVLINKTGIAHLYGNIVDNTCSGACGAILQYAAGGKVVFHEGNYSNNSATRAVSNPSKAGLVYVNAGTVEIVGGTFAGNTSTGYGNLAYIISGANLVISGGTFDENQSIYVDGTANISGTVVGANLIKGTGTITVNGQLTNSSITITPNDYTVGTIVLTKAEGVDDGIFADVCGQVLVTPNSSDNFTYIVDETGALKKFKFTIDGSDAEYDTLADAVTAANKLTSATIRVNGIVSLKAGLTISKDITITNVVGKNAVIKRNSGILMFTVSTGGNFTLGSNDTTGSITVDAATASTTDKRVIDNKGTLFVLGKNATIKNANSTVWGNVLINRTGEAHLYGNIINNTCSGACGPILQNDAGKVVFHEGNYSNNSATRVKNADTDSSLAGLVYVNKGTVEILGGTFSGNTSTGYGNLAYVKSGANLVISGGTIDADQNVYRES